MNQVCSVAQQTSASFDALDYVGPRKIATNPKRFITYLWHATRFYLFRSYQSRNPYLLLQQRALNGEELNNQRHHRCPVRQSKAIAYVKKLERVCLQRKRKQCCQTYLINLTKIKSFGLDNLKRHSPGLSCIRKIQSVVASYSYLFGSWHFNPFRVDY